MSLQSILVLVIIFVLLGVAIGFIANSEKGWQSGTVYLVNVPALLRKFGVENDE